MPKNFDAKKLRYTAKTRLKRKRKQKSSRVIKLLDLRLLYTRYIWGNPFVNEPKNVIFFLFYINFVLVHVLMIVMVIHTSNQRGLFMGEASFKNRRLYLCKFLYTFIVAVNPTLWGKEVIKVSLENLAL